MRREVVRHLVCPLCRGPLSLANGPRGPLTCPLRHSFDQARHGYVQLSAGPLTHAGDSAGMIAARAAFLGAGHYDMITDALRSAATSYWRRGLVLDVGVGTGHHLSGVLDGLPDDAYGLGTDVSKPAARAAARAHARADAIVCDAWQPLPIADASVGLALNVFAPRPGREFARVLRPDGALLVVVPTAAHLSELIEPLGLLRVDPAKTDRVAEALDGTFTLEVQSGVSGRMSLSRPETAALVGMGPSAWHTDPAPLKAAIDALPEPATVTVSVTLSVYRPNG